MTDLRRSFKRTTSSDDDAININQNFNCITDTISGGVGFNSASAGGGSVIGITNNTIVGSSLPASNNTINSMGSGGRKTPLLKRINNSQSNSGSSSNTTATTTTTTASGGGASKELNYCEVYYLSPSKRKSRENLYSICQQQPKTSSSQLRQQQTETNYTIVQSHNHQQQKHQQQPNDIHQLQINPVQHFQSDLNWTSNCTAGVTIPPVISTSTTTPSKNFKNNKRETTVFGFNSSAKTNGGSCDQNLDNFDILSHYSDSVAVVTKSSNNHHHHNHHYYYPQHNILSGSGGGVIQHQMIRNGSTTGLNTTPAIRTNNVTFSNCTGGGSSSSSSVMDERFHNHNFPRQHQQQQQIHSNRGSLRRSKGRSNQSLCSCDAGESTDIIPDPNRPLYQYSLDRKKKSHTYTCEQNAQILMRLEREKNSRNTSTTNNSTAKRKSIDKQGNELNYLQGGGSCGDYNDLNDEIESDSTTEIDLIPPPPPPISLDRKQQLSLKQDLMEAVAIAVSGSSTNINNNNNNASNITISNTNASNNNNNNNNINCLKSSVSIGNLGNIGESMLNDCTSTILNCANVGQMVLTGNSLTAQQSIGITKQQKQQQQPDLCQLNRNNNKNNDNRNQILLPNKQGVSLIVNNDMKNQHTKANQENIPLTPYPCVRDDSYIPCFKSSASVSACATNKDEESVFFYHQESPQYAPNFDNRPLSILNNSNNSNNGFANKYNTIGPSSCYAKQLANHHFHHLHQQQQQQLQHHPNGSCNFNHPKDCTTAGDDGNLANNGRYFSQSLTNFPSMGSNTNLNDINNHLHGQLDGYNNWLHHHQQQQQHYNSTNLPYTQFHTTNSTTNMNGGFSCSFGDSTIFNNSSSFTTIDSSNSGLKVGKDHHLHHHHHHQHQHQQMNQQQQQQSLSNSRSISSTFMPWKHRQCPSRGSSSSGTSSFGFDIAKHWLAVSSILLIIGAASVAVPLALRVAASAPFEERLQIATQLLDSVPLIDGHNDLPWNIRKFLHNKLNDFNFDEDLRNVMPWARSHWSHTDLQRLKSGRVSAQFWAAYVPCEAQHRDAVQLTLEQIDVIKRLTERYSPQLTTCTSASDIIEAHKGHKLCSLTGVEGGHSLGGSLAVLRTLYAIGVRYMTLTSTCHTPWADSSYADAPTFNIKHGGLTPFGKTIIREMNRLGMIVDLSHVSTGTMRDSLATTEAPVIFSHSSAYELCNSSRNVQDDILVALAKNGGLVMVNFYSKFLSCTENSTVHDAVAHINHIRRVAGIDHVGLGAGFDGINFTPKGLEDVSSYPTLFAELLGAGWSIDELKKLAGENFLRVMSEVEKIRDEKKKAGVRPYEDHPNFRTEDPYNCTSS